MSLRNRLYHNLGPVEARRILARLFPNGSIKKLVERRLAAIKEDYGVITEDSSLGIIEKIAEEILLNYRKDPELSSVAVT